VGVIIDTLLSQKLDYPGNYSKEGSGLVSLVRRILSSEASAPAGAGGAAAAATRALLRKQAETVKLAIERFSLARNSNLMRKGLLAIQKEVQGASLASAAQPSGNQWLPTIFQKIVILMSDSCDRRVAHDPLPEEAVGSETELAKLEKKFFSQEEDYMWALRDRICDIIEKHSASFLPCFVENVMPLMQRMEEEKLSLDREIVASIYADVVQHGRDKVKSDLMCRICNYFVSLTNPEEGESLRHDGAYGIGACVMYGGQCFAEQDSLAVAAAAAAAEPLMRCIVAAKESGDSSDATDNCISALAKVCTICAGKVPNLIWPEIFQQVSCSPLQSSRSVRQPARRGATDCSGVFVPRKTSVGVLSSDCPNRSFAYLLLLLPLWCFFLVTVIECLETPSIEE
jgi:hypothetical protein